MGRWDYVLAICLQPEKVISGHMICWETRGFDFDMGALDSEWFGAIFSPYMSGRTGTVYLLCDLFLTRVSRPDTPVYIMSSAITVNIQVDKITRPQALFGKCFLNVSHNKRGIG